AYIYERRLGDKVVDVLLNGTDEPITLDMEYYSEILPKGATRTDIFTGQQLTIDDQLTLSPRQTLILTNLQ
ncbi:MAG: cyclomaltodextrinase C-terminal domain-containing protein, partial [Muribaculaceae bacterium]|nr:cyclomaltodextrinase C-terminal domain-containing protein [Muribaculaceae bacterium]